MRRAINRMERYIVYFASFLLLASCLIYFYEIVSRYFFNRPNDWSDTVGRVACLLAAFLGGGVMLRQGKHINVDILLLKLKPKGRRILRLFNMTAAIVTCALLFWSAVLRTSFLHRMAAVFEPMSIRIPYWLIFLVVSIGFGLCVFFGLERLVELVKGAAEEDPTNQQLT